MGTMQVYDIIILIIVGWLTLRGAMKGMVSQLASIAAVIASFWAAVRFGPVLEPIMRSTFNAQAPWDKVLAITIAFVGASIAVMFAHRLVAKIVSAIRMKKFDRLCGGLFGFLKGVLIGMIITFFAVMLSEQTREMATQSYSGRILVRLIQRGQALLPEDVSALIESNLEGFRRQIESGAETAEDTLSQAKTVSKTASEFRNAFETLQKTISSVTQRSTGETDPADKPPSLLNETSSDTSSTARKYDLPSFFSSNRPTTPEAGETSNATSSENASRSVSPVEPTISLERLGLNNASTSGQSSSSIILPLSTSASGPGAYTNVSSGSGAAVDSMVIPHIETPIISPGAAESVLAPSAGLQPMTSTSAAPSSPSAATDWRTLLRNMR